MSSAVLQRVDLLMLRKRFFKLRIIHIFVLPSCKCVELATSQKSRFQAAKRSNMSSAILKEGQFADVQESCFQGAKRSNMGSALQYLG